jgi:Fic family protein
VQVRETDDPALFRFVTDRNLLAQYDLLERFVKVGLQNRVQGVSQEILRELNRTATQFLCETPGVFRECPIYITNSNHKPPEHAQVQGLMQGMLSYMFDNWERRSFLHLSAYALWTVNWVHPFVEGNGRTARAISYYVICMKNGVWFPGRNIIPQQIRADRTPYYAALRAADLAYSDRQEVDVSVLEGYLGDLLTKQLQT